jgi:hypothetical protein
MIDPSGDGRTNRERMLAGDPYIPDDPDNHRNHLNALKLTADFINMYPQDEAAALGTLSELLGSLGTGAIETCLPWAAPPRSYARSDLKRTAFRRS